MKNGFRNTKEIFRRAWALEKTRQAGPPPIESLARVDMALFLRNDQTTQYYVDEISRNT